MMAVVGGRVVYEYGDVTLVSYLASVRKSVLDYDRRHGYRGPEGFVDLRNGSGDELLEEALQDITDNDDLIPAVVLASSPKLVRAYTKGGEVAELSGEGLRFAQRALSDKVALNQRIVAGSIVRVQKDEKGVWQIGQLPQVEAAFVSADPRNGAVLALVGGFDKLGSQPASAADDANAARKAERKVEKLYRKALAELFQGDDFIHMFKRREIYRHLANAADRMAHCANTLHDIVVKIC